MTAGSAGATAAECTNGARADSIGACRTGNTLADNACSHHIPSLAPAVALPAPRHDRRRTGAAGSPPGGFPFVEGPMPRGGAELVPPFPGQPRIALLQDPASAGSPRRWSGRIAQLVEQLTLNQRVLGSSPSAPTKIS